jgi:DNA-directed RNA polymerase subunit RPC12/RpoP
VLLLMRSLVFDADLELARAVAAGLICIECGVQFAESHGHAVACTSCWGNLPMESKAETPRATLPESNRLAWSKRMRAKKESKWAGLAIGATKGEIE